MCVKKKIFNTIFFSQYNQAKVKTQEKSIKFFIEQHFKIKSNLKIASVYLKNAKGETETLTFDLS